MLKPLHNDTLIRALLRQPTDYTPIWIMRQAGRYLPEYRAIREQAGSFMNLCKNPELAAKVTLQPLERFNLDAAIVFSDILTIPDAMGLGLSFTTGEGPQFAKPIRSLKQVNALGAPDPETELRYVCDTIRLAQKSLNGRVPLIGFAGSPWTLACYMVEGGASKNFQIIKSMLYQEPNTLHKLLGILADATIKYLNAQIAAGAQTIMIFDTWGGILTQRDYRSCSLNYMTHIIAGLKRQIDNTQIPVILFTKNGGQWLELIADSGCDAIGLDWTVDLAAARQRVGHQVALQGNMDPAVLYAKPERIHQEIETILTSYGNGPGHVFNLGHGISQDAPPEHVAALVDAVRQLSKHFH